MAEPDYYELIGVDRSATLHEIRSKFRQKVLAEHPDKGGDPKKFQLLNKGYNILTDQEKRRRYDATGRAEKSAEEEFVEGFGGGRLHFEPRTKDADERAIVSLQDRIIAGPQTHEEGFAEWLRQRDQGAMVLTDMDFMKTHLFNSAELAVKVNHPGPVHHVLGSPKTDAYGQALGGAVQVQAKPRALKKTLDHDEVLVRMLAVPLEESMVYGDIKKAGVCLGQLGIGRVEQLGSRVENLKTEDPVLIMPKPNKFNPDKPIGSARTLVPCNEEDIVRLAPELLEDLTPEQLSCQALVVQAYTILEQYGSRLKPGDSVVMNAAHLACAGSSLLQLCKLLKLKPLCILNMPGAPKNLVKGEWGAKSAWQDADTQQALTPTVRAQYERVSDALVQLGAEEVFPDAVALLRWRDRNQRMLPKLALDGICTRDSVEQLIHCVQSGDKDSQIVVYGHGQSQPIDISPPLLAAWGGKINGFNICRWVHQTPANQKKMMAVMENVSKLVRSNKFVLEVVLYKAGEDAMTDAFGRTADPSDTSQVVLIFPTLLEELTSSHEEQVKEKQRQEQDAQEVAKKRAEEEERSKLKTEWLNLLFTDQSVAGMSPEGPLPVTHEAGDTRSPQNLLVWVGDNPKADNGVLKDLSVSLGSSALMSLAWTQHSAGEAYAEFNVKAPEVLDGSWYMRDRAGFENQDLDFLHDVELLGRSLTETIEPRLGEYGLDWKNVCVMGFGKGAGVALYAVLMKLFPSQIGSMILFSPIVPFPSFMGEKAQAIAPKGSAPGGQHPSKLFLVWGNKNRSTPGTYRQLLSQTLRKLPEVHVTPDTLPEADHSFDAKSAAVLEQMLALCVRR